MMGVVLLAVEVYFVVTNSNRPDFWPDDTDAPYQDITSGLFSGYVHEDNLIGKAQFIFFSSDYRVGSVFKFWKWSDSLRINRFFKKIN